MKIPIENIYYLLCYAWNILDPGDHIRKSMDKASVPQDLLGEMLKLGLRTVLRKGVERQYQDALQETYQPSGKFEIHLTASNRHRLAAKAVVTEDHYSLDTLSNQALLASAISLCGDSEINASIKKELRGLTKRLRGVTLVPLKRINFKKIPIHRNNIYYRFPLHIAELIQRLCLLNEQQGSTSTVDFIKDDMMWKVFQKFVENFLAREQNLYKVTPKRISWQQVKCNDFSQALLPNLETDICLESPSQLIVVDTKFYQETLSNRWRETIKPENLFQIYSYVRNFSLMNNKTVDGLVLYPTVGRHVDARYVVHGHRIHFVSIDLAADWRQIRSSLLEIIGTMAYSNIEFNGVLKPT